MSDTKYINDVLAHSVIMSLDVSIWSGKAKLDRQELSDADGLPPEQMATLGSKKLFNPAKLRIFNALKARATSALDAAGTKFLGGWLVPEHRFDAVRTAVDNAQGDFNKAVADFISNYQSDLDDWCRQFPEWEYNIRRAAPDTGELIRKFGFSWQAFSAAPLPMDNSLDAAVSVLPAGIMADIAKDAASVLRENFPDGKDRYTIKALRAVVLLKDKIAGFGYVDCRFDDLARELEHCTNRCYKAKCSDVAIKALKRCLKAIADGGQKLRDYMQNVGDPGAQSADWGGPYSIEGEADCPVAPEPAAEPTLSDADIATAVITMLHDDPGADAGSGVITIPNTSAEALRRRIDSYPDAPDDADDDVDDDADDADALRPPVIPAELLSEEPEPTSQASTSGEFIDDEGLF